MLLPLITIPLTFVLIPDASMTDDLDMSGYAKSGHNETAGLLSSDTSTKDTGKVRVSEAVEMARIDVSSSFSSRVVDAIH